MKRPRIANPVLTVPGALQALMAFSETATHPGLPRTTLELVNHRVSQINGCSVCVEMHSQGLKQAGESDARLFAVAAWRDSSVFSDAERAALALAEAATRISAPRHVRWPDSCSCSRWCRPSASWSDRDVPASARPVVCARRR